MRIKLKAAVVGTLFLAIQAVAQEKKSLSLNEAIDLSLQNSKQLQTDQAKIDEAAAATREAAERRLPDAKVSGSYLRLNSANFDLKSKDNNSGGSSGESPKVSQLMYGMLNLSLPIYTGGKIKYGIESAEFLEKAARLDAEHEKDAVIQNTIEAFANHFTARTAVKLVKENLLQAQQRVRDFGNLEKNGLLARNDLLKAELQSSNTELSLLDAENNWQLANVNMNLMLGLPTGTELELDTSNIARKEDARVLDDYLQTALTSRKDVAAIDLRKKAAQSGVKAVKGDLYPSLALTGGYVAADIPNFFTVTNAVNAGVGVSYNIGSLWKTKSKIKQAEAQVKQLSLAESMLDDNLKLQVNKSYLNLLSSRKKIEVYAKAVEQAQENYRITKNKFDNNLATTADLIDADIAQLQARLSYTLSRADAFVAYHKLLQTAGVLSTEMNK
jgi:outer membrane protein TolC